MAENTLVVSGLLCDADESSVALRNTLVKLQSPDLQVHPLVESLQGLSQNLQSLDETIHTTSNVDLATLHRPLQQWIKNCDGFKQTLRGYLLDARKEGVSVNRWKQLRCESGGMNTFQQQLDDFDSIVNVVLIHAYLDKTARTADELKSSEELAEATTQRFQSRLSVAENKHNGVDKQNEIGLELEQDEAELLSTRACVRLCEQLSEHIRQTRPAAKDEADPVLLNGIGANSPSSENITKITNIGCGNNMQFMFNTGVTGKTLHGTNDGRGWFNRQGGGVMRDETARHIVSTLGGIAVQGADRSCSCQREEPPRLRRLTGVEQVSETEIERDVGDAGRFKTSTLATARPASDHGKANSSKRRN